MPLPTLLHLAETLATGRPSARELTQMALARIDDPKGEGARAFIRVHRSQALAQADTADALRAAGATPSPIAGIPISIKDLFDVAGEVTTAGSTILAERAPAARDATVVTRLRGAGTVIVGRTNLTEFAFSGVGLNPHYGTPGNPYDRTRIPGGSSSGAAVSVADGMAMAAIGTDTAGSVRIPSALCGLVGFKPTQARIPLDGTWPLASSLDSIGPLAASVACCALLDAVLAGEDADVPPPFPVSGLRLAVPETLVLDDLDETVAGAFERALSRLSGAGARIARLHLAEMDDIARINALGSFGAVEGYAWHRQLLADHGDRYDPRVGGRLLRGRAASAADYIEMRRLRAHLIDRMRRVTQPFDALVMPTVPIVAPPMAAFAADDDYVRLNLLLLRNTMLANLMDRCAITLPCQRDGELPVGLTLMGETMGDRRLLAMARGVEGLLR